MQSIKPEAREFITQASLGRASVEKVAAMLPDNDAELDEWIGEAVRERDAMAFTLLVLAAFSRERAVDGRHLVGGAKLVGVWTHLGAIAFRVQGDMPEYLLDGIRSRRSTSRTMRWLFFRLRFGAMSIAAAFIRIS